MKKLKSLIIQLETWFLWSPMCWDFYPNPEHNTVTLVHGFMDIQATFSDMNEPKEYYLEKTKLLVEYGKETIKNQNQDKESNSSNIA
jgi:hypothetical protein